MNQTPDIELDFVHKGTILNSREYRYFSFTFKVV
jgi:hypothetical protein